MKPASQAERDARGYHLLSLDPLQGLYQEKDDPPGLPKWPQPVNGPPRFECMKDRDRIPLVVCITAYNEPWAHKPPRTGEFAASTSHVKESGTIRATLSGVVGNVAALQQVRDRMHLPHDVRRRAPPLTVRHTSRMFPESVSSRFSRALSSRFGRSMPSHGRRGNDSASPASSQGTPAGAARARPSNVPPLPATSFTASGAAPPTDGTVAFENSARKPGAHVDPSSFDEEKLSERDYIALQPLRNLTESDIVVIIVFDGREKVNESMFVHKAGDPRLPPPLHPADMDLMKRAIEPVLAAEAAAAKKHDDDYKALVKECQERGELAPRKEPYVKPSTRHCHLIQRKFSDDDTDPSRPSINVIYAIKEQNGGKLNSHLWVLRGIMPFLDPKYVILFDAGSVPSPTAVLRLFSDMEYDQSIGGCCGEIMVDRNQRSWRDPVVMSQHFEYTMANLLDKAFESIVGYIGVLPGAFSAYRVEAINGAPLRAYFMLERGKSSGSERRREEIRQAREAKMKAEVAKNAALEIDDQPYIATGFWMDVLAFLRDIAAFFMMLGSTIFVCTKRGEEEEDDGCGLHPATANMYLAEDRILGFEIVASEGKCWTLRYNHAAQAATDVPDSVVGLIKQRRRWLNGSFFAMIYTLGLWHRLLCGNRHSLLRKIFFIIIYLWNVAGVVLAWLSIGNAYIAIMIVYDVVGTLSTTAGGNGTPSNDPSCTPVQSAQGATALAYSFIVWTYQIMLAILVVVGLGNKPANDQKLWPRVTFILAFINAITIVVVLTQMQNFSFIVLSTGFGSLSFFFICAFAQKRVLQIIHSVGHYVFLMPLYIIIIPIFSFCNTNDISWGTRDGGGHSGDKAALESRYAMFRSMLVIFWMATNWSTTQLFERLARQASSASVNGVSPIQWYAVTVAVLASFTLLVRVGGCFAYIAYEMWKTSPDSTLSKKWRECQCLGKQETSAADPEEGTRSVSVMINKTPREDVVSRPIVPAAASAMAVGRTGDQRKRFASQESLETPGFAPPIAEPRKQDTSISASRSVARSVSPVTPPLVASSPAPSRLTEATPPSVTAAPAPIRSAEATTPAVAAAPAPSRSTEPTPPFVAAPPAPSRSALRPSGVADPPPSAQRPAPPSLDAPTPSPPGALQSGLRYLFGRKHNKPPVRSPPGVPELAPPVPAASPLPPQLPAPPTRHIRFRDLEGISEVAGVSDEEASPRVEASRISRPAPATRAFGLTDSPSPPPRAPEPEAVAVDTVAVLEPQPELPPPAPPAAVAVIVPGLHGHAQVPRRPVGGFKFMRGDSEMDSPLY